MLERLWRGNVCRHGGLVYRDQTLDEARAALQLAVTCVQWLSTTQRAQALAKAAAARTARKQLLDEVKAGKTGLAEVLARADTDELVKKTKVLAVVKALPEVGRVRAGQLLEQAQIVDTRRVGGLGARQREALISAAS